MPQLAPVPNAVNRETGRLSIDILEHTLGLSRELLPPAQCLRLYLEVGRRIGSGAWRRHRTLHRLDKHITLKDYLQCVAEFESQWGWPCTIIHEGEDRVIFAVTPFSLGFPSLSGHDHRTLVTDVMTGVFGGLAEEAFGYGKVCLLPSDTGPRAKIRLLVYLHQSKDSTAADGFLFQRTSRVLQGSRRRRERTGLQDLSRRERQALQLVGQGLSNKQIAQQLGISVRTVEGHVSRICVKLDLRRRADLIRFSLRHKLASL